jgi:RNA polymerase sigma-70 factor (ECF subfamily)
MLGNKEAAGDVTQEVFMKLFKSRDNPIKINHLNSWLFILTRNLCLNQIRDAKIKIGLESIEIENPTGKEATAWENIKLQKALSNLEPDLKEALILKEYQGFSYVEISEIMGTSVGSVKSLLYKARIRLKEIYGKTN